MAVGRQITVAPNTKVHLLAVLAESGDNMVGGDYLLSNEGSVTVELGGDDIDSTPGSRVLKAGVVVGLSLDSADDLTLYVRGGATSGLIDAIGTK